MKTRKKRRGLKVFLVIVLALFVLIGAAVAGGFALLKHEYSDRTELMKSAAASPKKALVVYQPSFTPASYDVACAIAQGLNDSGYEVTVTNPGKHLSADISAYAVIVLGSPNYGSSVAEALTEYVRQVGDFTGKKVILYSTSGAVTIMPELEKLKALIHGAQPYAMLKFQFRETEKNKAVAYRLGIEAAA